jgi:Niemann-Pick C1 protein
MFVDDLMIEFVPRGHAAFGSALKLSESNHVLASYFMTYHTVLKSSADYISAMSSARAIAVNISEMLNVDNLDPKNAIQVFPYRWVVWNYFIHWLLFSASSMYSMNNMRVL